MKFSLEIILVIILLVLLQNKPSFLLELYSTLLGKVLAVGLVAFISHKKGANAGLLSALVLLILAGSSKEGFSAIREGMVNEPQKCQNARDCGACHYKCAEGECKADKIPNSGYIREGFIASTNDREHIENEIQKNPNLNTMSASCP
tara:strand:- start:2227 stop:2667 length:441 start_codon:yes stop_codon:yes gene_type:complete